MADNKEAKGYAEALLQINRNFTIMLLIISVVSVVFLPDKFTARGFSVFVYSGIVLLLTLPMDYMIPVFRVLAELLSELLHLSRFAGFCSRHRVIYGLLAGGSSFVLWLPLTRVLFSDWEKFWLMLFFVYAVIWAMFFHTASMAECREPLPDASLELQKQQSNMFWIIWGLVFFSCVTGILLPMIPYGADLLHDNPARFTSYQMFLTAVCITGTILLGIIGVIYHRYEKSMRQVLEKMQMQYQIQQGEMYIKLLTEKYRSLQRYQHDFKKHLSYIRQIAAQKQQNEIISYIESIQDDLQQGTLLRLTGNQTLDLLFSDYVQQAENNGVVLQVHYQPQVKLQHISAPDLCVMLGNLLDNAIIAASASKQKQVACLFGMKNEYYAMVRIANTCAYAPVLKNGVPHSSQEREGHGYGVQNVICCVEKYNGICSFGYDAEDEQFQAVILIPAE